MNRLQKANALLFVSLVLSSPMSFAKDATPVENIIHSSQEMLSDTTITTKVKGLLINEKVFGDKDISLLGVSVKTVDGIVYLKGKVTREDQATNAIKIAKSVRGVKKVVFYFKVAPTA